MNNGASTSDLGPHAADYSLEDLPEQCRKHALGCMTRQEQAARKIGSQKHQLEMAEQRIGFISETVQETKSMLKWVLAIVVGAGALQMYTTVKIATSQQTNITIPNSNTNKSTIDISQANSRTRAPLGKDHQRQRGRQTAPGKTSDDQRATYPVTTLPDHDYVGAVWLADQ